MNHPRRLFTLLYLGLAAVLLGGGPAAGSEKLRKELTELARQLKATLDKEGRDAVAIGAFTGPPGLPTSAGPGIQKLLTEELQKLKVTVNKDAGHVIKGDYLAVQDREKNRPGLKLVTRLSDAEGNLVVQFPGQTVHGDSEVLQFLGLTANLAEAGKKEERKEAINQALTRPTVHLAGPRVAADARSPFAIEVLVRSPNGYVPRPAADQGGLAFVPLAREEVFAVNAVNDSDQPVAVSLALDGLSMFAFSTETHTKTGRPYQHLVLPPRSRFPIKGWFIDRNVTEEFRISPLDRSAAFQLGNPAGVGTITATFSLVSETRKVEVGVGRGQQIRESFGESQALVGPVAASVSVRYAKE